MTTDSFGGRKFLLSIVATAAAVAVDVFTEKGLSEILALFLGSMAGIHGISNVMSKRYAPEEGKKQIEKSQVPEITQEIKLENPLTSDVESLNLRVSQVEDSVLMLQNSLYQLSTIVGGIGGQQQQQKTNQFGPQGR